MDHSPQIVDKRHRFGGNGHMPGVTPRQIRAARALLGWSQQDLADRAVVSKNTVQRLEAGKAVGSDSYLAIWKTLESAGMEFIPVSESRSEGVRLIETKP
ncbi:MAG: hypothetical protein RLY86_322 [Pseudomonadota bacterium]